MPVARILEQHHRDHLTSEGFSDALIQSWQDSGRIFSVSDAQAIELGFCVVRDGTKHSSPGLIFGDESGIPWQLRADTPIERTKGRPAKYLTMSGPARAIMPDGAKWLTEGWKDAQAGTHLGGITLGALAGVSHARKCLPQGSGHSFIFDSDAWVNPAVMLALISAAQHTGGKVQIVPTIDGQPKGGLCEWFKVGATQDDFKALLSEAMSIPELLMAWARRLGETPPVPRAKGLRWLCKKSLLLLDSEQLGLIRLALKESKAFPMPTIDGAMKAQRAKLDAVTRKAQARLRKVKGLKPVLTDDPKEMNQDAIASALAGEWRGTVARLQRGERWALYGHKSDGLWSESDRLAIKSRVISELRERGGAGAFTDSFVNGVVNVMEADLLADEWEMNPDLIPFKNGTLNRVTREFDPNHSPENQLTWQIPFSYQPGATCQPIIDWLSWTQDGDHDRIQQLRAIANMVLQGQTSWQRYVEIIGRPGTGKSTFCNLLLACIGSSNTVSSDLHRLETGRFELAEFVGKRLAILPDSDRFGGYPAKLKSLLGLDALPAEVKGESGRATFIFEGTLILTANEPVRFTDHSGAIERRRLRVFFNRAVGEMSRRNLIEVKGQGQKITGEFAPLLPGFVNWVLSMDETDVKRYCCKRDAVSSTKALEIDAAIEADPLRQWIDSNLIALPEISSQVGTNDSNRSDVWLFANYVKWCRENGHSPQSMRAFSGHLISALQGHGIEATKQTGRTGASIKGIALRGADKDSPKPLSEAQEAQEADSKTVTDIEPMPWDDLPQKAAAGLSIVDGKAYRDGQLIGDVKSCVPSLNQKMAAAGMMSND